MKIAVLDDYQDFCRTTEAYARLGGHEVVVLNDHVKDPDDLAGRLAGVEALVLMRERTPVTAALLDRLPSLRLVSQSGAHPHIDVAACTARGITVCSAVSKRPSYATAELTWALVLAAMRHVPQEVARLKAGGWQRTIGTGLRGRTLGVLGYGRLGSLVAGYGRAFGMRVLVWSRESSLATARADGYSAAPNKAVLFEESDVLTVHLRLLPSTRGTVSAQDLARMKPTALFVNTSRSGVVEAGALLAALQAGRPGTAALDVFEHEPVFDASDPLLALDNVVATPHLGYVERDGLESYYATVFDQVLAFVRGAPVNVLNPEAMERRAPPSPATARI